VDLSQYVGQRVTITGYFQTQGGSISDFEDPTDVLVYVVSVEVLDAAPATDDQYEGATVNSPSGTSDSAGTGESSVTVF
jgi:hypothetical protein